MLRFTEDRIQRLCTEAINANSGDDIKRIVNELRSALEEHVRFAKKSLESQAVSLALLDSANA